jgi:hypothetical protein
VRVIPIIDRPSIEVIDEKSSIWRVRSTGGVVSLSASVRMTHGSSSPYSAASGGPHQRSIQGISRPRRWQRSIAARCKGSLVAAAQSSSWLPWL